MGKGDAVGDLSNGAVGRDHRDHSGRELAVGKVEADVVRVGVAPAVDDDLVPGVLGEDAQVGLGRERPVGLHAEQTPFGGRDDEQGPVGQPVDAERKRLNLGDDLAPAVEIDGDQLLRAPVGQPETAVVPARRLGEREARRQDLRLGDAHPSSTSFSVATRSRQ